MHNLCTSLQLRTFRKMRWLGKAGATVLCATALVSAAQAGTAVPVPSGNSTYHFETLRDDLTEPPSIRFRYVQQSLSQDADYDVVADDLFALCQTHAAPKLGEIGADVGQIVVSLANEETIFGDTRKDVVQMFEVFAYADGQCAWPEAFE